ncbi:hypothetical protein FACS189437_07190 [Bacteroidia bacterium]|nr:hypothetical protein FACS189437_07190 [Bacteroidia bacterium]
MATPAFFFKKNRNEKSKISIAGTKKTDNVSKSSLVNVTNSDIKDRTEKIINIAVIIKFLL